ncbi:hypothetical protein [Amycolatopsis anabasis]|uniref:hypothetical protein n=1 Tax=Amycolatopsis anabasis TaxID=1840409 RepID=UPI00131D1D7C|nr:hypothetical protein [Amycolatopsis anabasis]
MTTAPVQDQATSESAPKSAVPPQSTGTHDAQQPTESYGPPKPSSREILTVHPGRLKFAENTRGEVEIDNYFKDELAENGVYEIVAVYRQTEKDGREEFYVIDGARRVKHALEAGVTEIDIDVRESFSGTPTEQQIKRILFQLSKNGHRKQISRLAEAKAHQTLLDLKMSPTKISKARHIPLPEVKNSLEVAQSELAAAALEKYNLTLEQAATLKKFEEHPDAFKRLTVVAVDQPRKFDHQAQIELDTLTRKEAMAQALAEKTRELKDAGVTVIDEPTNEHAANLRRLDVLRAKVATKPGTALTVKQHESCAGHVAWVKVDWRDKKAVATTVFACKDWRQRGHAERHAPAGKAVQINSGPQTGKKSEAEKLQINEARKYNLQWDSATEVRRRWLANFVKGRNTAPEGSQRIFTRAWAEGGRSLQKAFERKHTLLRELAGLPPHSNVDQLLKRIDEATDGKALHWNMCMLLCAMEEGLTRNSWRQPTDTDALYLQIISGLKSPKPARSTKKTTKNFYDYELAEVEERALTAAGVRRAEPARAASAATGTKPTASATSSSAEDSSTPTKTAKTADSPRTSAKAGTSDSPKAPAPATSTGAATTNA